METIEQILNTLAFDSWAIKVFTVVFAALLIDLLQKRIMARILQATQKTKNPWDEAFVWSVKHPLSLMIWVLGLTFAANIVWRETHSPIFLVIDPARDVAVIAIIAYFLTRLIQRTEINLIASGKRNNEKYDRTTLDAIAKLLRLSVFITASLVALQTLGFSISGVLAFGGIGGMAIGFAAKDMLANFFGGLMIYMDRPFSVGDWIRSPDREIEGTVERVGWRQTVIRTFDKRPLYIPNAAFTTIAVENPSRMKNRRIKETIGVRYDDASKMRSIIDDVKNMLKTHPEIDVTQTLIVNFDCFAPSSMDFFIYCFTKTTNWVYFHEVKQDVLLKIIEIIEAQGAECAFPTSTVHLVHGNVNIEPSSNSQ